MCGLVSGKCCSLVYSPSSVQRLVHVRHASHPTKLQCMHQPTPPPFIQNCTAWPPHVNQTIPLQAHLHSIVHNDGQRHVAGLGRGQRTKHPMHTPNHQRKRTSTLSSTMMASGMWLAARPPGPGGGMRPSPSTLDRLLILLPDVTRLSPAGGWRFGGKLGGTKTCDATMQPLCANFLGHGAAEQQQGQRSAQPRSSNSPRMTPLPTQQSHSKPLTLVQGDHPPFRVQHPPGLQGIAALRCRAHVRVKPQLGGGGPAAAEGLVN